MRLACLKLNNFRCYDSETLVKFDDITALVGKNDSGKSSILEALDIFFNDSKIDKNDASKNGDAREVSITCIFCELPHELIIDQDAYTNLADEYLLNSEGNLEIKKTYNCSLENPKMIEYVAIAYHPTDENAGDLIQLNNSQLKSRARDIGADTSDVNLHVNAELRKCIRNHVGNLECSLKAIALTDNNGKNVGNGLKSVMPAYALFKSDRASTDQDVEAQDPLKAAIKAAVKEKENELDRISEYIENEVFKMAELTLIKLNEMDPSLASTLRPQFSKPNWASLFKVSINGDEDIPINKRGSGVRRLILLNFFRAKAEKMSAENNSNQVIYAIEEPETSQHPSNQRLIINTLISLSNRDQVILTTHTPMLARYLPIESIRYITDNADNNREIISGGENVELNKMIISSLGILPDNSVKMFIGVEGKTDIPFLKNLSKVVKRENTDLPDLEKLEADGEMIFMPLGGSLLAIWSNRLEGLNRPEFHIYDRDTPPPAEPKYQPHLDSVNAREGCTAVATNKREMENYVHFCAINAALQDMDYGGILTENYGEFDDVPTLLAGRLNEWAQTGDKWGERRVKEFICNQAVNYMTSEMLAEIDPQGEVLTWFSRIRQILQDGN